MFRAKSVIFFLAAMLASAEAAYSQQFHLQEATIDDVLALMEQLRPFV